MALPNLPVPQLKSQQGVKTSLTDASLESATTNDGVSEMSARVISVSHNMSSATSHPLISNGKRHINSYLICRIIILIIFVILQWYC